MDGIMIYSTLLKITSRVDKETQARLLGYGIQYALAGEEPEFGENDALAFALWPSVQEKIDATIASYEAKSAAGKRSAERRAEQTANTVSTGVQQTVNRPSTDVQQTINTAATEGQPKTEPKTDTETEADKSTRQARAREAEERFERFWQAYPRKVDRKDAHRVFMRINPDEGKLAAMLASLAKWKASDQWTRDGERYIPHPTTWLNGERWNDEPPAPRPAAPQVIGKPVAAQQYSQRSYAQEEEDELPSWFSERAKAAGILA